MFNVLLDPLPTEYEGFKIDPDFQIGIQIMQALEDDELTEQERTATALSLLFMQEDEEGIPLPLPDAQTAIEGLMWFLTDWSHDRHKKKDEAPVMDFDIDQWRIYSAFWQHYRINLNTAKLHYWEFMGLLTTLPECAFTRVVDIRSKVITSKMGKEERAAYKKLKEVYALDKKKEVEYTDSQKEAIDEYDRMMEEQRRIREGKKLAAEAFKELVK